MTKQTTIFVLVMAGVFAVFAYLAYLALNNTITTAGNALGTAANGVGTGVSSVITAPFNGLLSVLQSLPIIGGLFTPQSATGGQSSTFGGGDTGFTIDPNMGTSNGWYLGGGQPTESSNY